MPGIELSRLLAGCRRIVALTGAGCSTPSGIPDYRDAAGNWKQPHPVLFPDFVRSPEVRRRYWARSALGWPRFERASPNAAHRALAELEDRGLLSGVITQNVDGLHQKAGSRAVTDLHGRLDRVRCLDCGGELARATWQAELLRANPGWADTVFRVVADGDAVPARDPPGTFEVPGCPACGGAVKPAVVFYGEAIPATARESAAGVVDEADALLVVGSSLMVYSAYRLVRAAAAAGKPLVAINLGRTRADDLLGASWRADCSAALPALVARLAPP